jgi:hypothetical protein
VVDCEDQLITSQRERDRHEVRPQVFAGGGKDGVVCRREAFPADGRWQYHDSAPVVGICVSSLCKVNPVPGVRLGEVT